MASSPDLVAVIYAIAGVAFLGGLALGALSTLARVLYYFVHKIPRPRLLTRDVIMFGGLALSFGLITVIRFLPMDTRVALTTGNVGWALATSVPAVVAVLTYCWFELAVIERAKGGD